ncbi:hypothetical protein IPH92_02115 [Candidatus Kaiserbacteria bacterium]|nr:MAG: hypothetical protein IPH92_02115 [Candidatus Kaiserbacteria bacterium]
MILSPLRKSFFMGGVLVLGVVLFFVFFRFSKEPVPTPVEEEIPQNKEETTVTPEPMSRAVIGVSVEGREIEAYTYGTGDTHLLFVGGIHGGYEWNSVLLAYAFMDYFEASPEKIPSNIRVTIIPSANPDGVYEVIGKEGRFEGADVPLSTGGAGKGRFNAHDVDLNRNFDCKWKPESTWRNSIVSAGTAPFSEPEASAIRDFVLKYKPAAGIFWHSQSNAVYASECTEGILSETRTLMDIYAKAAEYPAVDSFSAYAITGDVEGWLASIGVPAITVELKTHETIEWEKNLAGVTALFAHYSE